MRPIFCGNFEYDARQSDLERIFGKYGKVDRVDMKSGFAFVYMEDERDAEDAIRGLDRYEFGRRRLRVEWTKQERGDRRTAGSRRSSANLKPTKTLFVINFDPIHTRTRDLERHFDPYGKILNIRIRRNFAFIQYESQEEATKALEATNMSKLIDRVISVEYAVRDDDDKRNGYSPDRRGGRGGGGRSPDRGRGDRRRSPSPYQRVRGSPDYGRDRSASPVRRTRDRSPPYRRERGSPDYGRERVQSPSGPYQRERGSPEYDRDASPAVKRSRGSREDSRDRVIPEKRCRGSPPDYNRDVSPPVKRSRDSPGYTREASPPVKRGRASPPGYTREVSPPVKRGRASPPEYSCDESPPVKKGRAASPEVSPPVKRGRESPADYSRDVSPPVKRGRERSPEDRSPEYNGQERRSPEYARRSSASPDAKPEPRRSPNNGKAESPVSPVYSKSPAYSKYRSPSPDDEEA